jgi:cell division protein FtsB
VGEGGEKRKAGREKINKYCRRKGKKINFMVMLQRIGYSTVRIKSNISNTR